MAIVYSYKITAVRVRAENGLSDVVGEVDMIVTGKDDEAEFSLPTTLKPGSPDPETFVPFANLAEEQIVSWFDSAEASQLDGVKSHIAYVVGKEAERRAMTQKPLPWAPAVEQAAPL